MSKQLAVIVIHGMGSIAPNFVERMIEREN